MLIESKAILIEGYDCYIKFFNNQDREIILYSNKNFTAKSNSQIFVFVVSDVVSFSWESGSSTIFYQKHKNYTQKLLEYWLAHTVFPIYLILEKAYYILHVGAVMFEDKPIVFMAPSFGGKSTLTDYFIKQGHKLITDDKLVTYAKDDDFYAISSFPYHRPYREMETLGDYAQNFETNIQKLQTVYVLKKVSASADVTIEELKGIEKFTRLHHGTEMDFKFLFQKNTQYLSKLANKIKVFEVSVPWDLNRLKDVYATICLHQSQYMETLK